jgi:hypothetical protein
MAFKVISTRSFEKQVKRLQKKYASLKRDLLALVERLEQNPTEGVALGNNFFKIRLAISSKARGKSGGARVITYVKLTQTSVFLTAIYDKSEKSNISNKELEEIFKSISNP